MASIRENIEKIKEVLPPQVKLVAVSKFHPVEALKEAYDAGQRAFGESRPQELAAKVPLLPFDIEWHFIGHLQTNKLKMVLPYAYLVQSVDTLHLLGAISAWGEFNGRKIRILLEMHLGAEQTKQGFSADEIREILSDTSRYPGIVFCGLMGMATNTDDESIVRSDFERISSLFTDLRSQHPDLEDFRELSIGMSADYPIAIECGATMVRIGTDIFGPREY